MKTKHYRMSPSIGLVAIPLLLMLAGQSMAGTAADPFEATNLDDSFDYATSVTGLTKQPVILNSDNVLGTEPVSSRDKNFVVGGYVSEWAQYVRQFDLEKIEANTYTNLVYAFVGICGDTGKESHKVKKSCDELERQDFQIVPLDVWGGFQSTISERQKGLPWNEAAHGGILKKNYDALNPGNARGMMEQLLHLKKLNKDLKIAVSVGGWTLSTPFAVLSASPEKRKTFIVSIVAFLDKWQLDEVDLDWEFPNNEVDGRNFAILVDELKVALDAKFGKGTKTISSAVGGSVDHINKVGKANYAQLGKSLDKIYLMNYDYWGSFENNLSHLTNLYGPADAKYTADRAVKLLEQYGVPKKKIILGVANYARGKKGEIQRPGQPESAINVTKDLVFGTFEDATVEGYDLFSNIAGHDLKGKNKFSLYTDKRYNADYYYNSTSGVYLSIDTPRTAFNKAKYAKENGLGGVFAWSVEQDHLGYHVNAMNEGLGNRLENKFTSEQDRDALYQTCGINLTEKECSAVIKAPLTRTVPDMPE